MTADDIHYQWQWQGDAERDTNRSYQFLTPIKTKNVCLYRHRNEHTSPATNSPSITTSPTTTRLFDPTRFHHCHIRPTLPLQQPILFKSVAITKCEIMARWFHLHSAWCHILRSSCCICRREMFQKQSVAHPRTWRSSRSICPIRRAVIHLSLPQCIQWIFLRYEIDTLPMAGGTSTTTLVEIITINFGKHTRCFWDHVHFHGYALCTTPSHVTHAIIVSLDT